MNIQTKYHGEIHVSEENFITFKQGIPGFPTETSFILLPLDQESPFTIMQSKMTPDLGFVVVNPFLFFQDYEFDLIENDKEILKITTQEDMQILSILTVKDPFSDSTANLQAPVVINHKEKLAKQIILNNTPYTTRHRIIQEKVKK